MARYGLWAVPRWLQAGHSAPAGVDLRLSYGPAAPRPGQYRSDLHFSKKQAKGGKAGEDSRECVSQDNSRKRAKGQRKVATKGNHGRKRRFQKYKEERMERNEILAS